MTPEQNLKLARALILSAIREERSLAAKFPLVSDYYRGRIAAFKSAFTFLTGEKIMNIVKESESGSKESRRSD